MPKDCKTCSCGCGTRFATHYRNGKYWISRTHFKNWQKKEKAKKEVTDGQTS